LTDSAILTHAGYVNRTQASAVASVEIRQAGSGDRDAIRDFLAALSPRTNYLRFFTTASPTTAAMLRILTGVGDNVDAVVAAEKETIIGHAMAVDKVGPRGTDTVEIGVVVTDARQGGGIGSALVRTLTARAKARGATSVAMDVLAENRQVLDMIENHWPGARRDNSTACVTIHARLPQHKEGQKGDGPFSGRRLGRRPWDSGRRGQRRPTQQPAAGVSVGRSRDLSGCSP